MNQSKQIACSHHHQSKYDFCIFYDLKQNRNVCSKCITEFEINPNNLVPIQELLGENEYFDNWPIFDKTIQKKISSSIKLIESDVFAEETQQRVISFFDDLKTQINEILEKSKKKIILKIQSIESQKNLAVQSFKCQDTTNEFKELWRESLENEEKIDKLKQFIQKKESEQKTFIDLLMSQINEYQNIKSQVDIKLLQKSKEKIIKLIDELDIFEKVKEIKQQNTGEILLTQNSSKEAIPVRPQLGYQQQQFQQQSQIPQHQQQLQQQQQQPQYQQSQKIKVEQKNTNNQDFSKQFNQENIIYAKQLPNNYFRNNQY